MRQVKKLETEVTILYENFIRLKGLTKPEFDKLDGRPVSLSGSVGQLLVMAPDGQRGKSEPLPGSG